MPGVRQIRFYLRSVQRKLSRLEEFALSVSPFLLSPLCVLSYTFLLLSEVL